MPQRPPVHKPPGQPTREQAEARRKLLLSQRRPSPTAQGYDGDWCRVRRLFIERYPLAWPHGWPREQGRRKAARFYSATQHHGVGTSYMKSGKVTISDALDRLERELARLGVNDWEVIVSTNLVLSSRGAPLSNQAEPRDPGAAVYFGLKGKDRVLACDRWNRAPRTSRSTSGTAPSSTTRTSAARTRP